MCLFIHLFIYVCYLCVSAEEWLRVLPAELPAKTPSPQSHHLLGDWDATGIFAPHGIPCCYAFDIFRFSRCEAFRLSGLAELAMRPVLSQNPAIVRCGRCGTADGGGTSSACCHHMRRAGAA